MIGQHNSISFVKVKKEPLSPESAAKANGGSSSKMGASDVTFNPDGLSKQSSAFSYNLTYAVQGNYSPSVPLSSTMSTNTKADIKPPVRADTSLSDSPDNSSIYSPASTFPAAPGENELLLGPDANSSDYKEISAMETAQNAVLPTTCDHYEYPRYYFEALIDDAQIRYDKASEFFANMRTYSSKCDVYVTILQDLYVELAKPPPTLKPELYKRLARLRRSIRHLQLKMASRRPRTTGNAALPAGDPTPTEVMDVCDRSTPVAAAVNAAPNLDVTSSVQEPELKNNLQESCLNQTKMKELLEQKIYDLAMKERELRQVRHEAEAELKYLFGGGANADSTARTPTRPNFNCIFCSKHYQSYTCWNVCTLEERQGFFQMYKLCFTCTKQHSGDCHTAGSVVCAWPQCGAKGDHNSIFCPNATYPVTKNQILALRALKNKPPTFVWPPESTQKEVPVSNELPVSHPTPVKSPLSNCLSTPESEMAVPSKRSKKRVTVTVLKEPPTKKQCR